MTAGAPTSQDIGSGTLLCRYSDYDVVGSEMRRDGRCSIYLTRITLNISINLVNSRSI